jgi:hypothetical protein
MKFQNKLTLLNEEEKAEKGSCSMSVSSENSREELEEITSN